MCAYCASARAVHMDHVVPKSLAKRHDLPAEFTATVPACFACNTRKGARRLLPPSWADKVDELNELLPGTPWRVWAGSVDEPAYREVHV